ncbi:MAG TPA: type II toxin-antitoxin system PemK/MazF family toxin [Ilumatobacteraceae bacterium]|nr:type II toxin-antitoxin system PemK/MazF family toxin [Ilumatobacteraceae bacterium]
MGSFLGSIQRLFDKTARSLSKSTSATASSRTTTTSTDAPSRTRPVIKGVRVEYTPDLDGDPDPGEVVWTWVPYEDDPSQGKDRPVVIIGRTGDDLAGVPLTSKDHDRDDEIPVGTGPWDRDGRQSFAKVDQLLSIDPDAVRREGAVLARNHFDDVVAGVARFHDVNQS